MRILIIGSGGREHAIAWKIAQSEHTSQLFIAPGNAGTAEVFENVNIAATDIDRLLTFAQEKAIDLTIVGPEAPLAAGIVDRFTQANCLCLGPSQQAAKLEASKAFSKSFMAEHHIPTADYAVFTEATAAITYINQKNRFPIVIKADGLAAGKGVIIAQEASQAQQAIEDMLLHTHWGQVGKQIIIEEYLTGEELSFIAVTDGNECRILASSQDHKARDNGDLGPNTGGMGAYSPAPILNPELEETILSKILWPTIHGMQKMGHPYTGFLYVGLMIRPDGSPSVLEFNCRLGDPEAQVLLMRLKTDFTHLCHATTLKKLHTLPKLTWDTRAAVGVVLTTAGYPSSYEKGKIIHGLDQSLPKDTMIFHAGTARSGEDWVTQGGRVLCVAALGEGLESAQKKAYERVKSIHWSGMHYRTDIGHRGLKQS